MKRILALFVLLIITGCGVKDEYRTKISKEEYETDYSSVYAEIIEFDGFKDKEYQSELNIEIQEGVEGTIKKFDSLAQEAISDMPQGVKSAMRLTQNVKRNRGGIISWVEEQYVYLGGAHGNTSWYPRTIDLREDEPEVMELSDLFANDRYIDGINKNIDRLVEKHPERYGGLWAEPHITEETENTFYLTDEELVIFFPPYELSYYAKGFIEFPIRLTELSEYLKEEYRPQREHIEEPTEEQAQ